MDIRESLHDDIEEIRKLGEAMESASCVLQNENRHEPPGTFALLISATQYWGATWSIGGWRGYEENEFNMLLDAGCRLYKELGEHARRFDCQDDVKEVLRAWAEKMSQKPQRALRLIVLLSER